MERNQTIKMEIIDFQTTGVRIKDNYGFFGESGSKNIPLQNIFPINQVENGLVPDTLKEPPGNPFKSWLKAKADKMLGDEMGDSKFLGILKMKA